MVAEPGSNRGMEKRGLLQARPWRSPQSARVRWARARRSSGGDGSAAAAPGRRGGRAVPAALGAGGGSRPDRAWCSRGAGARSRVRVAVPGRTASGRNSAAAARAPASQGPRCAPRRPPQTHRGVAMLASRARQRQRLRRAGRRYAGAAGARWNAMIYAAGEGRTGVVTLLLANGIDPNAV